MFTNLANPLPMPPDENYSAMMWIQKGAERQRDRDTNQESATGVEWAAERIACRQSEWPLKAA
jgi:hypothetical protein